MPRRIVLILVGMLSSGCVDIPKFEPPPPMSWEVVPLNGSESAANVAILVNKQTGETWITWGTSNAWQAMQK